MKNWVNKRFDNFPEVRTEYDEKTHRGSSVLMDNNNEYKAGLSFYLVDMGLLVEEFHTFATDIDLSLCAAAFNCSSMKNYENQKCIRITSCLKGRGDFLYTNRHQQYISGGELAVNCGQSIQQIRIQSEEYTGLSLCLFLNSPWLRKLSEFSENFLLPERIYDKLKAESAPTIIKSNTKITEITKEILECLNSSDYDIMSLKIIELFILMDKEMKKENCSPNRRYFTSTQMEIAKKTHDLLTEDLSMRYSAKDLAQMFGISETSLKNYFKGVYGIGYRDYQKSVRMRTAADLLTNTKMKVLDISLKVGFKSQTKFSICFKTFFGMNPLEFRRKSRLEHSELSQEEEN